MKICLSWAGPFYQHTCTDPHVCALEQNLTHRLPTPVCAYKLTQWSKVKQSNASHFVLLQ